MIDMYSYVALLTSASALALSAAMWRKSSKKKNETESPIEGYYDAVDAKPSNRNELISRTAPTAFEGEPRLTDEEVDKNIRESFEILSYLIDDALKGGLRSMIVAGPPGLGKSFSVEEALAEWDANGERHSLIKGYVRPTGLYRMLYKHRHAGEVIIFDDADSVFNDETSLNILKAVLDTSKKRNVSYMSERRMKDDDNGEMIPKTFTFEGTIIFITNLDFDAMIEREHRNAPHFKAMLSRSHYIDLDMKTRQDYIVRIKQVIREGMLSSNGLSPNEIEDVIHFIEKYANQLRELSLRTAIKVGEIRQSGQGNWLKIARATTCRKR